MSTVAQSSTQRAPMTVPGESGLSTLPSTPIRPSNVSFAVIYQEEVGEESEEDTPVKTSKYKGKAKASSPIPSESSGSEEQKGNESETSGEVEILPDTIFVRSLPVPNIKKEPVSSQASASRSGRQTSSRKTAPKARPRARRVSPKSPFPKRSQTSSAKSLTLHKSSIESEIPIIEGSDIEGLLEVFDNASPEFMCAKCIVAGAIDCTFQGWSTKCAKCTSGCRPRCTFILSPEQRAHDQNLLAIANRDSGSEIPWAISHAQLSISHYTTLTASAIQARHQVLSNIQRVGNLLEGASGYGALLFPNTFNDQAVISACDLLDLIDDVRLSDELYSIQRLSEPLHCAIPLCPPSFLLLRKSWIFRSPWMDTRLRKMGETKK